MVMTDLTQLLSSMQPVLNEGKYYFVHLTEQDCLPPRLLLATIQEREGLSAVVSEQTVLQYGLQADFACAWITLTVHSDLAAVGLTAAFSQALGQAGISCNVVAGFYHDHIFVPYSQGERALAVLQQLQQANER